MSDETQDDEEQAVVLVVDDDASVRDAIVSLLESVGQKTVAFPSAAAFLAAECPDAPCCVVLDVRLPARSGLDLQRDLRAAGNQTPVIFISGHADVAMAVGAMKAGAVEFLAKPFRDQDLLDAVHRALDVDRTRRCEAAALDRWRRLRESLSPREREIMALVASGLANKEVAATLSISEITVKTHRAQVMRKMEARSLPELVRIADRLAARDEAPDASV
ncbi:response regulator transcription factor [Rubrimonas cliftonensis]|uniref:Two component transcriptional regulator, LuxR family n=1 Tax=Rubrimonas cliftonensis TaxID=89524 RepID=A0A1H4FRD4_9RHOB|nr:response regulator [Rubrimonas cliftonensis]SEA99865.1 two component transcriptional regulator, LuxR family [Rubrimonas cliftonensis]